MSGHVDVDLYPAGGRASWHINEFGDDAEVTVWVETEGTNGPCPWKCAPRRDGFAWATQFIIQGIAHHAAITGCSCAAFPESIACCTLDQFADADDPIIRTLDEAARRGNFGPDAAVTEALS